MAILAVLVGLLLLAVQKRRRFPVSPSLTT
ncbi:MAG: hypothetical protein SNJ82_02110 [Gemmataceae bacterium]